MLKKTSCKSSEKARKHSATITITECFLAGAQGLELLRVAFRNFSALVYRPKSVPFRFQGDPNDTLFPVPLPFRGYEVWDFSSSSARQNHTKSSVIIYK